MKGSIKKKAKFYWSYRLDENTSDGTYSLILFKKQKFVNWRFSGSFCVGKTMEMIGKGRTREKALISYCLRNIQGTDKVGRERQVYVGLG